MLNKKFFIILTILNNLKTEKEININWIEINEKKYPSILLYTGISTDLENRQELNLILNFENEISLIPNKEIENFGMNCDKKNDCYIKKKETEKSDFYCYKEANGFFRFEKNDLIKNKIEGFDFRLGQDFTKDYKFGKHGQISLLPSSNFLKYLKTSYNLKNLIFDYKKDKYFSLYLNYEEKNSFVKSTHLSRNENQWVIKCKLKNSKEENKFEDCFLDFFGQFLLAYNGGSEFCKKQINLVCKGNPNCDENEANLDRGENLEFLIDNYLYKFFPKNYLKFENGKISCLISEKEKFDYSLGVYFFEIFTPVLDFGENVEIKFLDFFSIDLHNKLFLAFICVLVFLIIIVSIGIYWISKKRKRLLRKSFLNH